jgi:uncharacterized membrane protein YvlD (DUF360 family)
MAQLIASAVAFTIGMLLLPALVGGVRVRGMTGALKAGLLCGVLSVLLGKVLLFLLTLVFFLPIVLTGPIGVFVVQGLVNAVLLGITAHLSEGIAFDSRRTMLWAAFALTALQTVAQWLL